VADVDAAAAAGRKNMVLLGGGLGIERVWAVVDRIFE
jgi:hypothetical protein